MKIECYGTVTPILHSISRLYTTWAERIQAKQKKSTWHKSPLRKSSSREDDAVVGEVLRAAAQGK